MDATSITAIGALAGAVAGLIGVLIGQYLTERRHREALRQTAELEAQRADKDALLKYFEVVGQLLSDPSKSESLKPVIQAQTLTSLEALEPAHKRILLHFLYEVNLLDPEKPGPSLSLRGANLAETNMVDVDGRRALLEEANLVDVDGRRANLAEANLARANLRNANLAGANLRNANLAEVNLRNANLAGANLRNANLKQADLSGAFLQEMTEESLTQAQIDEAVGSDATKLPDHLQRPAHWRGGLGEKELRRSRARV